MIFHANRNREAARLDNLSFLESDYETLDFENEFDCAVFFSSLHHAVNEGLAVHRAFQALRSGAVCLASEPGKGHHVDPHTIEVVRKFQVTEKEMPPKRIVNLGRRAGFRRFHVYVSPAELARASHPRPEFGNGPIPGDHESMSDPADENFWIRAENIPCLRDQAALKGGALRRCLRSAKWFCLRVANGWRWGRFSCSYPARHLAFAIANLRDSGLVLMVK